MSFIDLPERSEEWHAHRRKFIGGSEIAGLFGAQPDFGDSEYTLFLLKSGKVQSKHKGSGRAVWGTQFEPTIAAATAQTRGWKISKGRYATDDSTPGMGASLDYEVIDAGADRDGVQLGPILFGEDEVGQVMRAIDGPLDGPGSCKSNRPTMGISSGLGSLVSRLITCCFRSSMSWRARATAGQQLRPCSGTTTFGSISIVRGKR